MKTEFKNLTDREILILVAEKLEAQKEKLDKIEPKVEKHEKFKNTLVGATSVSLIASISAFIKSLFN